MMVGETYEASPGGAKTAASYLGSGTDELHLAFDFSLLFSKYGARHFAGLPVALVRMPMPDGGLAFARTQQPRPAAQHDAVVPG